MGLSTKSISNTVLELGALEVPVAIHAATEQKDVSFKLASSTGGPVVQRYLDEATGEMLQKGDCQSGIFVGDEFKPISKDAIDAIRDEGKLPTIAIDKTQPIKDLPTHRVKGTYYLTTQTGGVGAKSLRVIRDALKRSKLAAIGKMSLKGRQYPFAITATNGTLTLTTMRFADSYRDADQYAESMEAVEMDARLKSAVKMTTEILGSMVDDDSPLDAYSDDAIPAKEKLLDEAIAGKPVKKGKKADKAASPESDDLMERLQEMAKQEGVTV